MYWNPFIIIIFNNGNNKCDFLIGHLPPPPQHTPKHIKQYNNSPDQQTVLFIIAHTKVLQGTKTQPMSYAYATLCRVGGVGGIHRPGEFQQKFTELMFRLVRAQQTVHTKIRREPRECSSSQGGTAPSSILPHSLQPSLYSLTHIPMVERDSQLRTRVALVGGAGQVFTL